MKKFLWLSCILPSLVAPAFGVTLYAAGVKTVAACDFATEPLKQIVDPLAYPAGWKIIVACTDEEWLQITRHFDASLSQSAFTMRDVRITVVNARIFRQKIYSGPVHTLRHELGHIICNSKSEDVADNFADTGICLNNRSAMKIARQL
jgi:hypothetical protein